MDGIGGHLESNFGIVWPKCLQGMAGATSGDLGCVENKCSAKEFCHHAGKWWELIGTFSTHRISFAFIYSLIALNVNNSSPLDWFTWPSLRRQKSRCWLFGLLSRDFGMNPSSFRLAEKSSTSQLYSWGNCSLLDGMWRPPAAPRGPSPVPVCASLYLRTTSNPLILVTSLTSFCASTFCRISSYS